MKAERPLQGADSADVRLNLAERVQNALGAAIVRGEFPESLLPTEDDLALRYGVSRTVIREAVKVLAAKNLLRPKRRAGTMIESPRNWRQLDADVMRWQMQSAASGELLRHFAELRWAIQPAAAFLAAGTNPDVAMTLQRCLDQMGRAQSADDLVAQDAEFHLAILAGSQNPFFVHFRELIAIGLATPDHVAAMSHVLVAVGQARFLQARAAVCDAVRAGNPSSARRAMAKVLVQAESHSARRK